MTHIRASEQERRYINIVFFVCGLLILLQAGEFGSLEYHRKNWTDLVETKTSDLLRAATLKVGAIQRDTRRVASDLAVHPTVVSSLLNVPKDSYQLFELLSTACQKYDVGIEIYNSDGNLIAWDGISGPAHEEDIRIALQGRLKSSVTTSTLYSQLYVVTPVRSSSGMIGVVLVRRQIDVHYPLINRYITREGLTESVSQELDVSVRFEFTRGNLPQAREGYASSFLLGIDSSRIGTVSLLKSTLSSEEERIRATFRYIRQVLLSVLIILLVVISSRRINRIEHSVLQALLLTGLIWLTRYLLLWLEVPSLVFQGGIFDPAYFASKFGTGLAKSIGELSLTCLALLINVVVILRSFMGAQGSTHRWNLPRNGIVRVAVALAVVPLIFLLLRGYGATIRSAVFDSALMYTNPVEIIPTLEANLMVVNLFLISLCLIIISVGLTSLIVSLLSGTSEQKRAWYLPWVTVGILYGTAAVVFDHIQVHPLFGTGYRLLFGGSILIYTFHLHRRLPQAGSLLTPSNLFITLGLAAIFFYPLLDRNISEKDREKVQVFAAEFLRPVDTWLTSVVNEALQSFQTEEVVNTIAGVSQQEIGRLALELWAKSSACREGYSALFAIMDPLGQVLSRYSIGNRSLLVDPTDFQSSSWDDDPVQVQHIGSGVHAFKVYRGVTPIVSEGQVLAYGYVVVAAGQQTLFRGESPAFLRSPAPESLESFYRQVTVAEFRHSELFASNNQIFPSRFVLPSQTKLLLDDTKRSSFWSELKIGDRDYEVLFVRGSVGEGQVIALCLPVQDVIWHIVAIVKMFIYYFLIIIFVLGGYLTVCWFKRVPYRTTFRDRLLVALLLTALLPLILIAYYGKASAEQRLMDETAGWLERETDVVAFQILQMIDSDRGRMKDALTPQVVEEIASDLDTDFNVYVDNHLESTSRPELYAAGLLDRRLGGAAFSALALKGEKFYHQTETVGGLRYAVGYRSVFDRQGSLLTIVSVPTLYRQHELEQEVAVQNAFLFGLYAVVFFFIIVISTTVANRIASPIHQLTEATRRVARGDLDVTLDVKRTDGEIGELVRSFEAMTRDLKRDRDELIRYERELAWTEMAKQVAHEIKNPLTPMRLSIQHLRQTYKDKVADFDRVLEEVTRTVVEQIDTLSRIASEFSRFGRMPPPNVEPCDVNIILEDAIRLFEHERHMTFEKDLDRNVPTVRADREELRRAFINIIRNGLQAMNAHGRMVVKTRQKGTEVSVSLRDFGPGIPDEIRAKLFQPNFSTKTEGMGLGLAIVKKTVDNLRGAIWIESKIGAGTEVTIQLPGVGKT